MKRDGYFHITRTATYGFLAALPLLAAYEVLILLVNEGTAAPVRVGADVWIKDLISLIGPPGMFAIGIVVLLVGAVVFFKERKEGIPLRPRYFGWMLLESTVYAVVIALIVSSLVGAIFQTVAVAGPQAVESLGLGKLLALSLGAGLYEELVFRVILVGGLFWAFSRIWGKPTKAAKTSEPVGQDGGKRAAAKQSATKPRAFMAYVAAAVIGAVVFSSVHYIGALGDEFAMSSFAFRFFFGLALNGLFLARGFGVAAWTHAIYDVLVVTHAL